MSPEYFGMSGHGCSFWKRWRGESEVDEVVQKGAEIGRTRRVLFRAGLSVGSTTIALTHLGLIILQFCDVVSPLVINPLNYLLTI